MYKLLQTQTAGCQNVKSIVSTESADAATQAFDHSVSTVDLATQLVLGKWPKFLLKTLLQPLLYGLKGHFLAWRMKPTIQLMPSSALLLPAIRLIFKLLMISNWLIWQMLVIIYLTLMLLLRTTLQTLLLVKHISKFSPSSFFAVYFSNWCSSSLLNIIDWKSIYCGMK